MKTIPFNCRTLLAAGLLFTLATASRVQAGKGYFDANRGLTLNVYFDYVETQMNMTNKWTDYYQAAAAAWYNALEGNSRIKRIYIFNHVPEGKSRADIWTKTNAFWEAYASSRGFQSSGLVTFTDQMDPYAASNPNGASGATHHINTFHHELSHYIFGLSDCYGGQIYDASGSKLPLQYFPPNMQPDPSASFRTYMWSDPWVRSVLSPMYIPALPPGGRVFYNVGGGPGNVTSCMDINGPEFSTAASHIGPYVLPMKFSEYQYTSLFGTITRTRASDGTNILNYTIRNNQEEDYHTNDWAMIAAYFGINPPASCTQNNLPADQKPEIIIVDGAAAILCLDRSGSMEIDNRIKLARLAAQGAVGLFRARRDDNTPGQIVGVTSFDDATYINATPREIVNTSTRQTLNAAIGAIVTGGSTSIGGGLRVSLNQLLSVPNPSQKIKTIILLSDGQQNAGEDPANVVPDLITNEVVVYTVALGSDADRALLSQIALATGGRSFVANSPLALIRYFLNIYADTAGNGTVRERTLSLALNESHAESIPVDTGSDRLTLTATSDNPQIRFSLRKPDGSTITPDTVDPSISYSVAGSQRVYDVIDPLPGLWEMVATRSTNFAGGPFLQDLNPDLPIIDHASITNTLTVSSNGTIAGLTVFVDIQHTYTGDLLVELTSPQNTKIALHRYSGSGNDNLFGTYGDDLVSADSLDAFESQPINGTWTLTITDSGTGDIGTLRSWALAYGGAGSAIESGDVSLAAINSNPTVIVDAHIEDTDIQFPDPLQLRTSVHAGGPVVGASVWARIAFPNGGSTTIPLVDNGDPDQGDQLASDGVYNALFTNYVSNGVYDISVTASNFNGYVGGLSEGANILVPVQPFVRNTTLQATLSGVPPLTRQWLSVDQFTSTKNPLAQGKDAAKILGSFNLISPPNFEPTNQTATFSIDNFQRTFTPGKWKRLGRTLKYTQVNSNYSATIDYFLGGSSRSKFTFDVKKTTLTGALTTPYDTTARLVLGQVFDNSVHLDLDAKGISYKLGTEAPDPLFFVDTLSVTRNLVKTNSDAFVLSGRVLGDFFYSPAFHGIHFAIGDFDLTINPGAIPTPVKGTKLNYKTTLPGGPAIILAFDYDKGTFSLRATKANFSGITNPLKVSLELTGVTDAKWDYQLQLQQLTGGEDVPVLATRAENPTGESLLVFADSS